MEIQIAVATPSEAPEIAALRTQVADDMTRQFGHGHWSKRSSRAEVRRQMRVSQMLVARAGPQILGTVRLVAADPRAFDPNPFTPVSSALYVLGLAVSAEHRKRGIGRILMNAAADAGRERGAQALWLDVYEHPAGAGPFYVRCGFRRVGPAPSGEVPLTFYEQSLLVSQ